MVAAADNPDKSAHHVGQAAENPAEDNQTVVHKDFQRMEVADNPAEGALHRVLGNVPLLRHVQGSHKVGPAFPVEP